MTTDQRKAARATMGRFPLLKIDVGEGESSLTPYLQADPTNRGATVDVTEGKLPSNLARELETSCRAVVS